MVMIFFAPILNHANRSHLFFLQDCTNLVICKLYHAQFTKDPSWYWIFLMIFHSPFQLVSLLFQTFSTVPTPSLLVICSDGTKGSICSPSQRLCPPLALLPSKRGKWPKISHFQQFFIFLPRPVARGVRCTTPYLPKGLQKWGVCRWVKGG